jgi:3-oxoacyl-(acyl-carrier-protein) synthase
MRRVVVTGLGIVSSIGDGAAKRSPNLCATPRSGVIAAPDHITHGFRSQVWAPPSMGVTTEDWAPRVDRRAARFLAVGPFAVPKAMSSTASATLATWFKIKGVNYSISSACATSNHCIGNAYEMIQWGKQDVIFAGGCEELDWTLSVLFDAMGAMSSEFNDTPVDAPRAPMTSTATASSSPAAPASSCSKNSSTPRRAAPRSMARSSATARPRTATTWSLRPAKAPSAA